MLKSTVAKFMAGLLACLMIFSVVACEDTPEIVMPSGSAVVMTPIPSETPFPTGVTFPDEEVTMVVTKDTISRLEQYPNLKKADLTGSLCYEELAAFAKDHPNVEVIYLVSIGAKDISSQETSLTLADTDFDFETLKENLKFLPKLTAVSLTKTGLTDSQIESLKVACPGVTVTATKANSTTPTTPPTPSVPVITDTKIDVDAAWTKHDWSSKGSSQLTAMVADAKELSTPCVVKLSSSLSKADVKKLQQAAPKVIFDYTFTLYGKELSTLSKTVSYTNVSIGDAGAAAVREALDILTKCTHFKLDNCHFSNEVIAKIRDDYASRTQVVWRIYHSHSGRSWLTDTTVLRAVYHVDDSNSGLFKYLTKVKYVDLGHNTTMKDLSFFSYMPDLELVILSGSPITDLSPLSNCKKLDFLEVAWCGSLSNVEPLAQCPSLKFLNLSYTRVKDLSPLKNLPLEQLSYINSGNYPGLTKDYWTQVQAWLPTCWITCDPMNGFFTNDEGNLDSASPYGVGWRYKANWGGYTDCYKKVRTVFNLDYVDSLIAGGAK